MDKNIFNITQYINVSNGFTLNTDKGNDYRICVSGDEIGSSLPYHVTISDLSKTPEKIIEDFHMCNDYRVWLDEEAITLVID